MFKQLLTLLFVTGSIVALYSSPILAQEQPAEEQTEEQATKDEKTHTMGYGTVAKNDPKGQSLIITEYNWDTNEIEDVLYRYNIRFLKIFNMANISELKPGDEVEFEKFLYARTKKMISKISKGPMPEEPINLDFNFNLPDEAQGTPEDGAMQPVEVKEGADVNAPEIVSSAEQLPVVTGSQAVEPPPAVENAQPSEAAPAGEAATPVSEEAK